MIKLLKGIISSSRTLLSISLKALVSKHSESFGRTTRLFIIASLLIVLLFVAEGGSADSSDVSTLKIDLPPEVVYDVIVVDTLPNGLVYEPNTLEISGTPVTYTENIQGSNDGTQPTTITWSFGRVDNSADQDILIQFMAVVADIASNRDGTILGPGSATLNWKDSDGVIHGSSDQSRSVQVVEPGLLIDRRLDPSTAKVGDTVTCTFSVHHSSSSHSNAYDVDLSESIPQGLTYIPGSMEILAGPDGTKDDSKVDKLDWHFDDIDRSWYGTKDVQLRYKAKVDNSAKSSLTCSAGLSWASIEEDSSERRVYSDTSNGVISITSPLPRLNISMADNPDPVRPGGQLIYTISYLNKGGPAHNAAVSIDYDGNLGFISADPAPDTGTDNHWTLGDLAKNDSGIIKVTVKASPSVPDGSVLTSSSTISCSEGIMAQASATTNVKSDAPLLYIEKTASSQFMSPGETLNYTINYKNKGDEVLNNVTVSDIVDKNLKFDPADSTPQPTKVWADDDGTHLWWSADALSSRSLPPGGSGNIELKVSLGLGDTESNLESVYNQYKIDSNEYAGSFNTLETFVVHSLWVRKTAEKQVYSTGDTINYTILYGDEAGDPRVFNNVTIYDILPNSTYVEYEDADPQPTSINGDVLLWNIGTILPGESGTIYLYVKIKENNSDINLKSSGSVSGKGFTNIHQKLDTAQKPDHLTNYVNITGYYKYDQPPETKSSSATILLADATGTAVSITGHGSGIYHREEETEMHSKNRSIAVKTSLSEAYNPTSFSLPQGRSINYSSKWSEAQSAQNRVTGASLSERYMYATKIDRDSSLKLDKNETTLVSETSFEGSGQIGMKKQSSTEEPSIHQVCPAYEYQENYLGKFKVHTEFDDYGKNAVLNSSASGVGFVAADKRTGLSQRSYESGSGIYQSEQQIETQTNYIAKDINVSYTPVNFRYTPDVKITFSNKWKEGMWSKSGSWIPKDKGSTEPTSFIGEEFSQADYLKTNTIATGLNEMKTSAMFSGTADFKVNMRTQTANESKESVSLVDEYKGRYQISRNIEVGGVARFDTPHISVTKEGIAEPAGGSFMNYVITVTNDGNRALGPIYVTDLFPPNTEYVYSSLRPSETTSSYAQWTLVNLGIGTTTKIDLKLKMEKDADDLVNRVQVKGGYDGQWVTAENFSTTHLGWLSCCPPQLLAIKTARIDPLDPYLIHYNISLKNRENSVMVASIIDQMPAGISFINSSTTPENYSSEEASWNIVDLKPDEVRTISYLARAQESGVFANQAHIEAYYGDGSGSASADITSSVQINGEFGPTSGANWQPPGCFGLNCTQQGFGDEWIPCESCGATGAESQGSSCPLCTSTSGTDETDDIP